MLNIVRQTQANFDENIRDAFLNKHGWAIVNTVGQDSSIRRYFRLRKGEKTAILMETVPDSSPHATPGHSLSAFLTISKWLNEHGANAPDIYEVDEENGLVILEDFGGMCFKYAAQSGNDASLLYQIASETLEHIAAQPCDLDLPHYYDSHVHARHRRIIDWYVPLVKGRANSDGVVTEYKSIWSEIEEQLPPCPQSLIHVDYHAENLMWLPQEIGIKRCGILDFQGAMIGPAPYDLANLLEDARTDVPPEMKEQILSAANEDFRNWFRILATQFHCRVIGQFIKMAVTEDAKQYLTHIPRLESYLREGLNDPILKPLKSFFDDQKIDFSGLDFSGYQDFNSDAVRALIRSDAY